MTKKIKKKKTIANYKEMLLKIVIYIYNFRINSVSLEAIL